MTRCFSSAIINNYNCKSISGFHCPVQNVEYRDRMKDAAEQLFYFSHKS